LPAGDDGLRSANTLAATGFTDEEINRMTRTAIEAAFVDEPTRQRLLARI